MPAVATPLCRMAAAAAVALPMLATAVPVRAELLVTPYVTTSVTYTDNVDFEPEKRSDVLPVVTLGVRATQRGRRASANLDASLNGAYSVRDADFHLFGLGSLFGTGTAELVTDLLFVDAEAGVSREVIDQSYGASAREYDLGQNSTFVQRYAVSPYLRYRFGSFADGETRVRLAYLGAGTETIGNAVQAVFTQTLSSGPNLQRFLWKLTGQYSTTIEDATDEEYAVPSGTRRLQILTIKNDDEYVLNRNWSLLAGVGYESIRDNFVIDDINGIIWDAGVRFQAARRFALTLKYGWRYDRPNWFADLAYTIGPRTELRAGYTRTLETDQQRFLADLAFIGVSPDGVLIDTRTGQPVEENRQRFTLRNDFMLRDRAFVRLTHQQRRNNFVLEGFFDSRESYTRPYRDQSTGVLFGWSRALAPQLAGGVSLQYERAALGDIEGRIDHRYTVQATLTRTFGPRVYGSLNYSFRHYDRNQGAGNITENAVTVSLTRTF